MNVVYAVTRNYYPRLIPSVTSLIEHNPKAKVFVIAEDDELGVDLPVVPKVINVSHQQWFPPDGVNYHNRFTYINLLKVCYPSLLSVTKVIHLDVDTIICDSLEELWKTNITGKWIAACQEYNGNYRPFGERYYNMGVALLNLFQLRKDNAQKDMVEYLNTVPQPWADQDAWHAFGLFSDKFVDIDVRFNENRMTGMTGNPAIVHYCGIPDWWDNRRMERREYLERYAPWSDPRP